MNVLDFIFIYIYIYIWINVLTTKVTDARIEIVKVLAAAQSNQRKGHFIVQLHTHAFIKYEPSKKKKKKKKKKKMKPPV